MADLQSTLLEAYMTRKMALESALSNLGTEDQELVQEFFKLFEDVHATLSGCIVDCHKGITIQNQYGPELTSGVVKLVAEHGHLLKEVKEEREENAPAPLENGEAENGHDNKVESPRRLIPELSSAEFEKIPRYVKDRVPYDAMKPFIDQLEVIINKKYLLLSKPRAQVSRQDMEKVKEFRSQEKDETRGMKFFVPGDLKHFSSLAYDSKTKKMLAILTYVRKLKEIRGPGPLVRYAVPRPN
ncbi:hypothetical protein QYM36_015257 [Artemia franciscana]|uniref:SKA complex subunit 1 n=1 Tax=Artemia franciscana TaxID=6661 RepID=A0AA88HKQ5_ARTSF|nr:hypothetical protein QYM36_015257 [Artemia franciscana]KAK2707491.1 hypothetical protein QYM36_015257 [Artemia franciscana]